jgi:translation elongation factor EF-G
MYQHVKPIVRVALETERIQDMPLLKRGMMLLNQVGC